jgi:hypothetical protein
MTDPARKTHSATCATIIVPEIGQPAQQCPDCEIWVRRSRDGMLEIIAYHDAIARPRWEASNRPSSVIALTVYYYAGRIDVYFPITDPASEMFGGSTVETLRCEHRHTSEVAAEECVRRLAERTIKQRNLEQAAREATPADAERAFSMFDAARIG